MTYEETVERVRALVADPESRIRAWAPAAGEPEVGHVVVHWQSPALAELKTLEGVYVKVWGRCGIEKDGHVCDVDEGVFHMTHVANDVNGQYTWMASPPPAFVPPTDGTAARAPGLGPIEEEPVTTRVLAEVDASVPTDQGKE